MSNSSSQHTIMPKKLAQALMEAGMKHFDVGGQVSSSTLSGPQVTGNGTAGTSNAPGAIGNLISNTPLGLIGDDKITGLLNDLSGQSNYTAGGANIQAGTNANQLNTSYNQVNGAVQNQQSLANTLNPQATTAVQNQQTLAQQLLNQSNGQGPNPAQTALNQSTGANVANTAALMASQRGASANPALVARNAALAGANTQQTAVGQAATLQAQQQLAAQQQLQSLSASQLAQTQGANTALDTAAQGEQGVLQGANAAENTANVGIQSNINNNDSAISQANAKAGANLGGLLNGASGAIQGITSLFAEGGKVGALNMKDGGDVPGKSKFPGNDYRNDTQPALLSKGEEVLPNSVTQSQDAPEKAKEFVQHLMEKEGKKPKGYDKVVASKKSLKERVEHLEKLCAGGRA